MRTREKLLDFFEKNKGVYFSGEELAARLSISRTAVWKAVNSLRKDGYEIDAVPNKGYCLSADTDILSSQGVEKYLEPVCSSIEIDILPTVGSTNDYLREKALEGQKEGFTVLSGKQTGGRGRTGRSFYSPADKGIYMSLLLRPENCSPAVAVKFTTMAAVAACRAIEKVSQKKAQIKWVNDVYLDGKKICGILTEAVSDFESATVSSVIIGIGINISTAQFPADVENGGSLGPGIGRAKLIAAVSDELLKTINSDYKDFIAYYRSRADYYCRSMRGGNFFFPAEYKQARFV